MEMHAHDTEPIDDNDLVYEQSATTKSPASEHATSLYHYEVVVNKKMRPPSDDDDASDVLERVREDDVAFLEAVQRNLHTFSNLKPGGKAADFRSLKLWNSNIRGPESDTGSFDPRADQRWTEMMSQYGALFQQETAQDNDFIVRIEYPTGEVFPIQVRRLSGDSLRS